MRLEYSVTKKIEESKLKHETSQATFLVDDGTENEVVNLYPDITYQQLEGFGGAITDAAGAIFSKLTKDQQDKLIGMYFDEELMNYQMVRIHMDSCDFSTHIYSAVEDETDIELRTFSFAHTEKYILPMLEAARRKAKKPLKLMLSPWSPPAFMKTNNSRVKGGALKPEYRARWAQYLCRYIKEFEKRGYEVARMSIQNEPKAVQTWDSCIYTAAEEKTFLQDYLYPQLQADGLDHVEVFIWDHNKERIYERARDIIDETTDEMVTGIAFHWYSGDHFEALDLIQKKYPNKKLILSESCLEFSKFDASAEQENAERLAHDMIGNLNHGMSSFYDWNMLLNDKGGPNHVGNFCDAPYLFHEETGVLEERMALTYYWHFTHFIKPGAVRMAHSRYSEKVEVTAWNNPSGEQVVIFLNKTEEELPCVLRMEGQMTTITLPPHSIVSGTIKKEN